MLEGIGSKGSNCVLIGRNCRADHDGCVVVGDEQTTASDGSVVVGDTLFGEAIPDNVKVMVTENPDAIGWFLRVIAKNI